MTRIFFIFLSLLFVNCSAEDTPFSIDETTTSVATLEGLPSSLVNGSVCAISGQYIDQSLDFVLPGPEPLFFQRTYTSTTQQGNLGIGWNSNHCDWLSFSSGNYEGESIWGCVLAQSSGARLFFKHKYDEKYKKSREVLLNLVEQNGLTNGAGAEISGRTNPKNNRVSWYPKEEMFKTKSGASTTRTFKKKKKIPGYYLEEETRANGSALEYDHEPDIFMHAKTIRCLNARNRKVYSNVSIKYLPDVPNMRLSLNLKTSDERKYAYEYFVHRYDIKNKVIGQGINGPGVFTYIDEITQFYLEKVVSPYKPTEKYKYTRSHLDKGYLVCEKKLPDQRYQQIKYYHSGHNFLCKQLGSINVKEDNYRCNRVRSQSAPVGTTSEPIPTHYFTYKVNTRVKSGRKELRDGFTQVYDAYHHLTRFQYDEESHLSAITKYSGTSDHQVYSREHFLWGKNSDKGNLKARYQTDADGNISYYRGYQYDKQGNITKNSLYGCLTGKCKKAIELDKSGKPAHYPECERKTYTYNELNLLLTETDGFGKTIENQYRPDTDILMAKFVLVHGEIKIREFYTYDENNIVIKKIVDDGSTYSRHCLTGVTERHITEIKPRSKKPLGLPEKQSEYDVDLKTGELHLKSKVLSDYTPQGWLCYQAMHDANNTCRIETVWKYNDHGKVTQEIKTIDPKSDKEVQWVTLKEYDDNDNLIMQKGPLPKHKIKNTYDFMNRLIQEEEYLPDGQIFTTTHAYDYLGNCVSTVDPYGQETRLEYDDFNRPIKIHQPCLEDQNGAIHYPVLKKEYDIAGHVVLESDEMGHLTTRELNIRGQPLQINYADGTFESFKYRLDGKLIFKCDRNGLKTHYTLDPLGRVIEENIYSNNQEELLKKTAHVYNAFHLIQSTDPAGLITAYSYDIAGRVEWVKKSHPSSKMTQATQHLYDAMGNLTEVREWFGEGQAYRATIKIYDSLGHVIEERVEDSTGKVYQRSCYAYDMHGNRTLEQCGEKITRTEYNAHNNPIRIIDSLGHETHTTYNTKHLNALGQCVLQTTITDPLGYQIVETYDAAKRLVETARYNPYGILLSKQTNHYDPCGQKCKVLDYIIEAGETKSTTATLWIYNNKQLIKQIEAAGEVNQKETAYKYSLNQKTEVIKPDGTLLKYAYDLFGRLKSHSSSDNSIHYTYEYDLQDNVIKIIDQVHGAQTERSYNPYGQLEWEVLNNGLRTDYTYDRLGRMLTVTLPDHSAIAYTYDCVDLKEVHRIKNKKKVYAHINQNRNLAGQVTSAKLANQTEVRYHYDLLNRCIEIESPHFNQSVPKEGFDARGNLHSYYMQNELSQFEYDDLNQITSEKGHTYTFDSLANRTSKNGEEHTYNALHQLVKKGQESFRYDRNGNLVERSLGKKKTTYSYDALDRLIQVKKEGKETNYTYDSFNRRLTKNAEAYLYLGQEELGKWESGKLTQFRLLCESRKSPMVAMELENTLYVPIYDLSGNVACLLDATGECVERYRYTVFGECESVKTDPRKQINNPWQFAGKRGDSETGFISFGLRDYDPGLGRWVTPDPIGFEDGPNLYAYVHNNPLTHFDQFGLYGVFDPPVTFNYERFFTTGLSQNTQLDTFNPSSEEVSFTYQPQKFRVDLNQTINPKTSRFYVYQQSNLYYGMCNGILNDRNDITQSLVHASELANHLVIGVHCPTFGIVADLLRYGLARAGVASESTWEILNFWHDCFDENPNAYICWTCHSRGVVDTRNALLLFPPELRKRITVIAVAPGCFIDKYLCESVTHLVSYRDLVPLADFFGMIRCRDTVEFLKPHPQAPWFDHAFNSPTYERSLQLQYTKFKKIHS